jgi:hypothetical protein
MQKALARASGIVKLRGTWKAMVIPFVDHEGYELLRPNGSFVWNYLLKQIK